MVPPTRCKAFTKCRLIRLMNRLLVRKLVCNWSGLGFRVARLTLVLICWLRVRPVVMVVVCRVPANLVTLLLSRCIL